MSHDLQEAMHDLQRYFSDQVAPLIVVDSVRRLFDHSDEVVAEGVIQWSRAHLGLHQGWLLSDLAYHALRKLFQLGELELFDPRELRPRFEQVTRAVVGRCPPDERHRLDAMMPALEREMALSASATAGQHFQPTGPAVPPVAAPIAGPVPDLDSSARRFAQLVDRLEPALGSGVGLASLGSRAAEQASNERELARLLELLQQRGYEEADPSSLLRVMADDLPDWAVVTEEQRPESRSGTANAMLRLVSFADRPEVGFARVHDLIRLGVDHFNRGSLGRALTLLELAERAIADRKMNPQRAEVALGTAASSLDDAILRSFASDPTRHAQLRRFLGFFPTLRPGGLLAETDIPDRQRRHLILSLFQIHGAVGRRVAAARLVEEVEDGALARGWFGLRNLIYLLRTIEGEPEEGELACVIELSRLENPPKLVKETFEYLGSTAHPKAEETLVVRLRQLDERLETASEPTAALPTPELLRLLGVCAKSLLTLGTSRGRHAVVESALLHKAHRSEAISRLAALGAYDLSDDPSTVGKLVQVLNKELPPRMLRMLVKSDESTIESLVQALSGTPHPKVTKLLREIASGYQGRSFANLATQTLERMIRPEAAAPSPDRRGFAGDLDLFGLPNLLQHLAENELSGHLALTDRASAPRARLTFDRGDLTHCEVGHLDGPEAFYQLLEWPFPGSFEFVEVDEGPSEEGGWMILPLLMEGTRRYDELHRCRTLVPDDRVLAVTDVRPTPVPGEDDGSFVREVWQLAKEAGTATALESSVAADSYRVRRLLAHWVEEGALRIAE